VRTSYSATRSTAFCWISFRSRLAPLEYGCVVVQVEDEVLGDREAADNAVVQRSSGT
jgi:hypothetical protein